MNRIGLCSANSYDDYPENSISNDERLGITGTKFLTENKKRHGILPVERDGLSDLLGVSTTILQSGIYKGHYYNVLLWY